MTLGELRITKYVSEMYARNPRHGHATPVIQRPLPGIALRVIGDIVTNEALRRRSQPRTRRCAALQLHPELSLRTILVL